MSVIWRTRVRGRQRSNRQLVCVNIHLAKSRYDVLKVLGDGELTKKLKVTAHRFSKSAREKIEKAGGEVVELPGKAPVDKEQAAIRREKLNELYRLTSFGREYRQARMVESRVLSVKSLQSNKTD